jgi:hypothetical protein
MGAASLGKWLRAEAAAVRRLDCKSVTQHGVAYVVKRLERAIGVKVESLEGCLPYRREADDNRITDLCLAGRAVVGERDAVGRPGFRGGLVSWKHAIC